MIPDETRRSAVRVLVVDQGEVRRLLPMAECLEVMPEALSGLARGEAMLPGLSVEDVSKVEDLGQIRFTVTLFPLNHEAVTVQYNTMDGSAREALAVDSDFTHRFTARPGPAR